SFCRERAREARRGSRLYDPEAWTMPKLTLPVLGTLALLWATPLSAGPLGPSSGFLATYAGPQNGDLDVTSAEVFLRQSTFEFDATFSADIGTTPGVFYVWGI